MDKIKQIANHIKTRQVKYVYLVDGDQIHDLSLLYKLRDGLHVIFAHNGSPGKKPEKVWWVTPVKSFRKCKDAVDHSITILSLLLHQELPSDVRICIYTNDGFAQETSEWLCKLGRSNVVYTNKDVPILTRDVENDPSVWYNWT